MHERTVKVVPRVALSPFAHTVVRSTVSQARRDVARRSVIAQAKVRECAYISRCYCATLPAVLQRVPLIARAPGYRLVRTASVRYLEPVMDTHARNHCKGLFAARVAHGVHSSSTCHTSDTTPPAQLEHSGCTS